MTKIIVVIKWEFDFHWIFNADGWWIQHYNGWNGENPQNSDHDKVACDQKSVKQM